MTATRPRHAMAGRKTAAGRNAPIALIATSDRTVRRISLRARSRFFARPFYVYTRLRPLLTLRGGGERSSTRFLTDPFSYFCRGIAENCTAQHCTAQRGAFRAHRRDRTGRIPIFRNRLQAAIHLPPAVLARMVFAEFGRLVLRGLAVGAFASLVAIWPSLNALPAAPTLALVPTMLTGIVTLNLAGGWLIFRWSLRDVRPSAAMAAG